MIQTNWYVITGAPSSGKTTLINRLSSMGYQIASEVAREYIKQLIDQNHTLIELKQDTLHMQRKILTIMLNRERQLPKNKLIFFDRGTPDSAAYFRFHHLDNNHVLKACKHKRYKQVFYCHGLPVVHDAIRDEDEVSAKKIGEYIYQTYIDLGYNIIELPAVSIEERLKIILAKIDPDPNGSDLRL